MRSKIGGRVAKLRVKAGESIEKGDLLLEIKE